MGFIFLEIKFHSTPRASCQIRKTAVCAYAGNFGNVFPVPWVNDPGIHHGTCVTHVSWCKSGFLTSDFPCSRWWGKRYTDIPGPCAATRKFEYFGRGPLQSISLTAHIIRIFYGPSFRFNVWFARSCLTLAHQLVNVHRKKSVVWCM